MATAEITVIPIGTESTSISSFVTEADKILLRHPDVKKSVTAMGTEIECPDIDKLFDLLKEMHAASFNNKAQRIYSIIKIDDRRDKQSTLESKIKAVTDKLG